MKENVNIKYLHSNYKLWYHMLKVMVLNFPKKEKLCKKCMFVVIYCLYRLREENNQLIN